MAAVTRCEAAYPLSDRTSSGALALSACVHHLLDPDGVTFLSVPAPEEKQFGDFDVLLLVASHVLFTG